MTTGLSVVPGKVLINGIRDISIPDYVPEAPTTPISLPVVHMVTPKGELGTKFIPTGSFVSRYGNVFDPNSLFFNPNSVLISKMTLGGQSGIGVRRLTANKKVSRIALSAYVQKKPITSYQRTPTGQFFLDSDGNRVPTGEIEEAVEISIKVDETAKDLEPGQLEVREIAGANPGDPSTHVFPLFELPAGIGDAYNLHGIHFGVYGNTLQQQTISRFVEATGVFPFNLRMFTASEDLATRVYTPTINGGDTATLTLFETNNGTTQYSMKKGIEAFTGTINSDSDVLRPVPFSNPIVYQENIELVCQLLYSVEKALNTNLVDKGIYSYRQMNPFTCKDHLGVPYYAIQTDPVVKWDMSFAVMSEHGINPFLDDEGNFPAFVTPTPINDPFGVMTGLTVPMTKKQAWEINNRLTLDDMTAYVASSEQQNVILNRQSMWWDVGYTMDVKEKACELLNVRKDIYLHLCATVYTPGETNQLEDIYSRLNAIVAYARLYPESEKWGTASMRFSVNKIEAIPADLNIDQKMSANIDLAHKWAQAGGNQEGLFLVSMSPDHGVNRNLTTMHSPNIKFEEDLIGANGLELGGITLRPYDDGVFFRPALPTGYATSIDSVCKDQVPVVIMIAIEKLAQSKWGLVCGDTTISEENYASIIKDDIERDIRDNFGGYMSAIVSATYNENAVGSEAVLHVTATCYFNKAKYMMEFDLFADNVTNYTGEAA